MKVTVFLADAARIDGQRMVSNVLGLGIVRLVTPTTPLVVLMTFHLEPDELDVHHDYELRLLDADGQLVNLATPPSEQFMIHTGWFEVPPQEGDPVGVVTNIHIAFHLSGGIDLPRGEIFQFRVKVDGRDGDGWAVDCFTRN